MMPARHIAAIVCLLVAALLAVQVVRAGGYLWRNGEGGPIRPHWPAAQIPVDYELSATGYVGGGVSNAQLQAEIEAAFASWNAVFPGNTLFNYLGETNIDDGAASGPERAGIDGHNVITFTDPDIIFDDFTLAFCLQSFVTSEVTITALNNDFDGDGDADYAPGTYPAGTLLDADIVFDGNKIFEIDGSSPLDVQAVMLHEAGHCAGLSHSSVLDATMFPFANQDVAVGRLVDSDDAAAIAWLYPTMLNFGFTYGRVTGKVSSGATGLPVVGAHVYAVDIGTGETITGAYTLADGQYDLVVPPGTWYLRIEPLDGDPAGLDPERINDIIATTTDRWFPEEYYDSAESNADDPLAAEPVTIGFFSVLEDIDFVTNLAEVASRFILVEPGANYIAYPVDPAQDFSAFDFLAAVAPGTGVNALQRFDPATGRFDLAQWHAGSAGGVDFPLRRVEGYLLQSDAIANVGFEGDVGCPSINLAAGFSLIGLPCAPVGYSAFDFLQDVGDPVLIESIGRYDRTSGQWQNAYFDAGAPGGVDFPIEDGEAYALQMHYALADFDPGSAAEAVPPALYYASPGQGVVNAVVTLSGAGLSAPGSVTAVSFAGVAAEVIEATPFSVTARVPPAAQSGNVTVNVNGLSSNPLYFEVLEATLSAIEGQPTDLISGQTATAAIDDVADIDEFNFVAIEGNLLTARAIPAVPGSPDLVLKLYGPRGGLLQRVAPGPGGEASLLNLSIPATGYYRLTVESEDGLSTGNYSLIFQLLGQASAPALHVLGGDNQTAVAGTQLPLPLEVIASGPQGTPAAGIDVTLVVQDPPTRDSGPARTSQSITQGSNAQGIVSLIVHTPNVDGFVYSIEVTAPGMTPVLMRTSVIDRPIAAMEISGDGQSCSGGCPVGAPLPEDYSIVYRDDQNDTISGVLTDWAVVSGDGSIDATSPAQVFSTVSVLSTSGGDGRVSVNHTLGESLYFDYDIADVAAPLIAIPQQVAATVPGQAAPVVFTASGRAGEPARITWAGANHVRISLGTINFSALKIRATDEFDNPVAGVSVDVVPTGGLVSTPGIWSGGEFTVNQTDARGFYVAAIGAAEGTVIPTQDEFGNFGTTGLSTAYPVPVVIASAGVSDIFTVDVNMGPVVTAGPQGESALIGQAVGTTFTVNMFRFQRNDQYIPPPDGVIDDDGGAWIDEENFLNVRRIGLSDEPLLIRSRRSDGRDLPALGLTGTTIDGAAQTTLMTDSGGELTVGNVSLGAVAGGIDLIVQTPGVIQEEFFHDDFLFGQTGESMGVLLFDVQTNAIKLFADPVVINIPLADKLPASGVSLGSADPYPGVGAASGIDLSQLKILLNGSDPDNDDIFFNYSHPAVDGDPQAMGVFPNYRGVLIDGNGLSQLDDPIRNMRPGTLLFTYRPTSDELQSTNTLNILMFTDDAANAFEDDTPPVLPFTFTYP